MADLDENRVLAYPPDQFGFLSTLVTWCLPVSSCSRAVEDNKTIGSACHHRIKVVFPRWHVVYLRPVASHSSEDHLEITLPAFNKESCRRGIPRGLARPADPGAGPHDYLSTCLHCLELIHLIERGYQFLLSLEGPAEILTPLLRRTSLVWSLHCALTEAQKELEVTKPFSKQCYSLGRSTLGIQHTAIETKQPFIDLSGTRWRIWKL